MSYDVQRYPADELPIEIDHSFVTITSVGRLPDPDAQPGTRQVVSNVVIEANQLNDHEDGLAPHVFRYEAEYDPRRPNPDWELSFIEWVPNQQTVTVIEFVVLEELERWLAEIGFSVELMKYSAAWDQEPATPSGGDGE